MQRRRMGETMRGAQFGEGVVWWHVRLVATAHTIGRVDRTSSVLNSANVWRSY